MNRDINDEMSDKVLIVSQGYKLDEGQIVEGPLTSSVFDPYSGETFSPVFMTWEKVLGCPVSEISLEIHGVEHSLLAILSDLTFWSTEEKKSMQIKNAIAAQGNGSGCNDVYALGACASP